MVTTSSSPDAGSTVAIANDAHYQTMVGVIRWSDLNSAPPSERFVALTLRQAPECWAAISGKESLGDIDIWDANATFIALALASRDGRDEIVPWSNDPRSMDDLEPIRMDDIGALISPRPWTWRVMVDDHGELLVVVYTEAERPAPPNLVNTLATDRSVAVTYGVAESKLTSSLEEGIRLAGLVCETRNLED